MRYICGGTGLTVVFFLNIDDDFNGCTWFYRLRLKSSTFKRIETITNTIYRCKYEMYKTVQFIVIKTDHADRCLLIYRFMFY